MSRDIIASMTGSIYNDHSKMQVVVVLHDLRTDEDYTLRFDLDGILGGRSVGGFDALITMARVRLAEQWGSIYA